MSLLSPRNLILLTIFCLPLYMIRVTFWIFPTNLLEILAFTTGIFTLYAQRKTALVKFKNIPKHILVSIALILLATALSIITNNDWKTGLGILKGWFIMPMFFSLALIATINSTNDLEKIYRIIFISSGLVSLISLTYRYLGYVTYDGRLSSFYLSPNHLAMYLAPGFILGIYFLQNKTGNRFFMLIFMAITISIYFTYSYGTWIAIFFSYFILFILKKRFDARYLLFFLILVFTLVLSQINSPKMQDIFQNFSRSSLASRLTIWNVSLRLLRENPFLGIGPGNFQNFYLSKQPFYPPYLEWAVPQPHNIFLAFWLQTGIIGLIGFSILLYETFKRLYSNLRTQKNATLVAPIFVFFLYTIEHGMIDTTYWKNDLAYLFWIFTAVSIMHSKITSGTFIKNHTR